MIRKAVVIVKVMGNGLAAAKAYQIMGSVRIKGVTLETTDFMSVVLQFALTAESRPPVRFAQRCLGARA